jgi:hypothetical protein
LIGHARLAESLARLAALLQDAERSWWIIGSAGVALHGAEAGQIRDIDVVLSHSDAERYFHRLALPNIASTGDPLFRSDLFARWTETPVEIEMMAGLRVKTETGWEPLSIQSRVKVGDGLFVPSRDELRAILMSFGREKDLQRAARLS